MKSAKVVVPLFLVLAVIVYDLSGLGGNMRFYAKWIECGVRPVVANQSIGFGASVSNYEDGSTFSLARMTPSQFCSPRDAELAGYSASDRVFSYPHLTAQEQRCLALIRNELPHDPSACKTIRVEE
jgi:hypothetical protein